LRFLASEGDELRRLRSELVLETEIMLAHGSEGVSSERSRAYSAMLNYVL